MPVSQQKIADIVAGIGAAAPLFIGNNFEWGAAIICMRVLDHWMDKKSAVVTTSLSDEQGKVIDFLATQFDTLCFGDDGHDSDCFLPLIANEEFLKHLNTHGIKKIFIENWTQNQDLIQTLESGEISTDKFVSDFPDMNSWVSESSNQLQKRRMANAISKGLISYRCVDTRGEKSDDEPNLWSRTMDQVTKTTTKIARFTAKVFLPKSLTHRVEIVCHLLFRDLVEGRKKWIADIDDTKPAQLITGQLISAEPCAIAYGSGHFSEKSQNYDTLGMLPLLKTHGRNPVVINIYKDIAHYRSRRRFHAVYKITGKKLREADVDFVLNYKRRPGRVIFNDKSLEAKFSDFRFG